MDKRLQFVIGTIGFSALFFLIRLVPFDWKYQAIGTLALVLGLFSFFISRQTTKNLKDLLISSSFPVYFTAIVGVFRFLFSQNIFWEIGIMILYVVGLYSVFLLENVFLVTSTHKTVPLYRAAVTVGFLLTLVSAFLAYDIVFSYRMGPWLNSLWTLIASFPLLFHFFWFISLSPSERRKYWLSSLVFSLVLGEVAVIMSFWPANTAKTALYLASLFYVFGGLAQAKAHEKLFKNTVREFIWVGVGIFVALILVTSWA
jgi:hypothetical protein